MKRLLLIIFLFILYICIINYKVANTFIEKIDLNLLDDELAIIFLTSDSYKTILLKDNSMTSLLVLDVDSDKYLDKNLNKFLENKLDYLFLDNSVKLDLDCLEKDVLQENINMENFSIYRRENIIELTNNRYNLCIYNVGDNDDISNCDFIYFMDMNYQITMTENLKAIFYENDIGSKFKENTYIKWIDNYELSDDAYNILKLSLDSYDIITIPNEN